jgi:hypothetical protein
VIPGHRPPAGDTQELVHPLEREDRGLGDDRRRLDDVRLDLRRHRHRRPAGSLQPNNIVGQNIQA